MPLRSLRHWKACKCTFAGRRRTSVPQAYSPFPSTFFATNARLMSTGPAVAGKNAANSRPVYKDWRREHALRDANVDIQPEVRQQIDHIHAKHNIASISPVVAYTTFPIPPSSSQNYHTARVQGYNYGRDQPGGLISQTQQWPSPPNFFYGQYPSQAAPVLSPMLLRGSPAPPPRYAPTTFHQAYQSDDNFVSTARFASPNAGAFDGQFLSQVQWVPMTLSATSMQR